MEPGAWAGWEATSKDAEGNRQVVHDRVTPSNLSFQLSARQIEIVGYTAEQFGAELQPGCEVPHQRAVGSENLTSGSLNSDKTRRTVPREKNPAI